MLASGTCQHLHLEHVLHYWIHNLGIICNLYTDGPAIDSCPLLYVHTRAVIDLLHEVLVVIGLLAGMIS